MSKGWTVTRVSLLLAGWTILAGIGIPLVGILNGGMAKSVGNPLGATTVMFAVAGVAAGALTLILHGLPSLGQLAAAPGASWAPGLLIGFYAVSATIIIPRFGTGNFVIFILVAQLATAAVVDQFGLLGMPRRPADLAKLGGFALILGGMALVQIGNGRNVQG